MIHLLGVLAAAGDVQRFCQEQGWQFCFIGGVAVQRWGEPRLTQDVDVTILAGIGKEELFTDALLEAFAPRRTDAREFALQHRVLLVRTAGGIDADAPREKLEVLGGSILVGSPGAGATLRSPDENQLRAADTR